MNERQYQIQLVKKLEKRFPGVFIIKNDARDRQGLPDILILHKKRWGMLEVKLTGDSAVQPNQEHYVNLFNEMSFASFINPTNEESVLHDLQRSLGLTRKARIP
jgi:hypothetical protein